MALYIGTISLNQDNKPSDVDVVSHVRVRIPQFHGSPDLDSDVPFTEDSNLPWARVVKPINFNEPFSADSLTEGTVVTVEVLNSDATNLIITGFIGNYTSTTDAAIIEARKNNLLNYDGDIWGITDFSESCSVSVMAIVCGELQSPKIKDDGNLGIKYNDLVFGKGAKKDWNAAFVYWCFNEAGLKDCIVGGNKSKAQTAQTIYDYHKSKNELLTDKTAFQRGDVLFLSWDGKKVNAVCFALDSLDSSTNTTQAIQGCVSGARSNSGYKYVDEVTIKKSDIFAVLRPGYNVGRNPYDPKWKQTDSRWASDRMGKSASATIGSDGCAMTSIAILMQMTGKMPADFSPKKLNAWLSSNGGYVGNTANIYWGAVNNLYSSSFQYYTSVSLSGSKTDKYNKIKSLLIDGKYLVVSVRNKGHYVAIVGFTDKTILMSNPGSSKSDDLFDTYPATGITEALVYTCSVPFRINTAKAATATAGSNNEEKFWNYFIAKNNNPVCVASLMGNVVCESAFNSKNLQNSYEKKLGYTDDTYTAAVDNGSYSKDKFIKDAAGYGLVQWTYWSRKENLYNYAKAHNKSIGDFNMQLDFMYDELTTRYSGVWALIKNATSIATATEKVMVSYENPADQSTTAKNTRTENAKKYYNKYTKK